jgi:hypothetical protein
MAQNFQIVNKIKLPKEYESVTQRVLLLIECRMLTNFNMRAFPGMETRTII